MQFERFGVFFNGIFENNNTAIKSWIRSFGYTYHMGNSQFANLPPRVIIVIFTYLCYVLQFNVENDFMCVATRFYLYFENLSTQIT